jgi:tRNA(Arg) A34 adenosine deaminase TadA
MSRFTRVIHAAYHEALKSDLHIQHGAVVTKGSKIVSRGRNNDRTSFLNRKRLCCHAEIDAVQQLIKTQFHSNSMKPNEKFSKYIVWVIRLGSDGKGNRILRQSQPCDDCLSLLDHLGFKRVGFSNCDGEIEMDTIQNLIEKSKVYTTHAHKTFMKIASSPYW